MPSSDRVLLTNVATKHPERRAISILVVDDEPLLRIASYAILTGMGFQVVTADSLLAATSVLQKSNFDVVISDIEMPNGSGIDLLCEINKMNVKRPIVILVSARSEKYFEASLQQGALVLLQKPINFDQLSRKIVAECYANESSRIGNRQ